MHRDLKVIYGIIKAKDMGRTKVDINLEHITPQYLCTNEQVVQLKEPSSVKTKL